MNVSRGTVLELEPFGPWRNRQERRAAERRLQAEVDAWRRDQAEVNAAIARLDREVLRAMKVGKPAVLPQSDLAIVRAAKANRDGGGARVVR